MSATFSLKHIVERDTAFYTSEQLQTLAVRGATLDELTTTIFAEAGEPSIAEERIGAWCQSSSNGDWEMFSRRLERDGLTIESINARLCGDQLLQGQTLPQWVLEAEWIVPALHEHHALDNRESIFGNTPIQAFENLYFELIKKSESRRNAMLSPETLLRVTRSVLNSMNYELLTDIAKLCELALFELFASKPSQHRSGARVPGLGKKIEENGCRYASFLDEMRHLGWRRLFDSKPVLLRLLVSLVRQWIDTTAEFLQRLNSDIDIVTTCLLDRSDVSIVNRVDIGLSDAHNFGRSVYIVYFASGCKVVYKPKDLSVDVAWFSLLDWLNRQGPPIDLRGARTIGRVGYGWTQMIEHEDIESSDSASRFFERAGALLTLFYILNGTDMHEENIVASGEYPVPIDLETLLQSVERNHDDLAPAVVALKLTQQKLSHSVLHTGLLPSFLRTPETSMEAQGGLLENMLGTMPEVVWTQINSDSMRPSKGKPVRRNSHNLPRLAGVPINIVDHRDSLYKGCSNYFQFILEHKSKLLESPGPLSGFGGTQIRRILRPTRFYGMLLERLRDHRRMNDGAIWSAQLDFVSRLANWDQERETLWPLLRAERRALSDWNIPFFSHRADDRGINANNERILEETGLVPGLIEARRRISELDNTEISWQLDVVRLTTAKERSYVTGIEGTSPIERKSMDAAIPEENVTTDAIVWSNRIAALIASRALRHGESAAWIGLDPLMDGGGWGLVALGSDLYGGAPGISLFLAAHAHKTGSSVSRELALAGLSSIRHAIWSSRASHFARVSGIGGATGVGSLIYVLTTAAQLLQERALVEDARKAVQLISDDLIASDRTYDVVGGAAGCVLALLKLYRQYGCDYALDRAVACGQHLIKHRIKEGVGKGLWRHLEKVPLTGFAHGAAGFAYALSALAKASANDEFSAVARDCVSYERRLFSVSHQNWPDLRGRDHADRAHWSCQWCSGAGGIGMARTGMVRFGISDEFTHSEISTAANTVTGWRSKSLDTLCCGTMGNAEFLIESAHVLGQAELRIEAASRIQVVLNDAERSGGFCWTVGGDHENLGFFRGLSGIGYTLLRFSSPASIPNVLIWE